MPRSMTAYSRAFFTWSLGRFSVELQSVNRRHLEVATFLPKELLCFDVDIKKWILSLIGRGQLTLKLFVEYEKTKAAIPLAVKPNLLLARQIKAAWEAIAYDLQLPEDQGFTLQMLAKEEGVILYENEMLDEELFRSALKTTVDMALERLIEMKIVEGKVLCQDILLRIANIESSIEKIAEKAPEAAKRYQQKLIERVKELSLAGAELDNEERIIREVALYAQRSDITEEIVRFRSHLVQFLDLIHGSTVTIGKSLEFLLQELNREINTIGSKSAELLISQLVVDIKAELDRIREQVQNIE